MESENHRQTPALPAVTLDHVQGFGSNSVEPFVSYGVTRSSVQRIFAPHISRATRMLSSKLKTPPVRRLSD